MVFDGALAAAGDKDHVADAGLVASSTAYWISGLSTTGSISLGMPWWRAETGAQAGNREHGFADAV
jgi:hypothetical protein